MTTPALVDIEILVVNAFLADTTVAALIDDRTGSQWLPDSNATLGAQLPAVRVTALPGGYTDASTNWLAAPRVQVDAWAQGRDEAFATIQAALAAVLDLKGVTRAEGVVTDVRVDALPWNTPEPEEQIARFSFTATLWVHPVVE